jgi:hypothetical protein
MASEVIIIEIALGEMVVAKQGSTRFKVKIEVADLTPRLSGSSMDAVTGMAKVCVEDNRVKSE